jgi:hypothetical protein
MSSNTGVIYGVVTSSTDGSPLSGVRVGHDWVQRADLGVLQIGGNDDLTLPVYSVDTAKGGSI